MSDLISKQEALEEINADGGIQYPKWWYTERIASLKSKIIRCRDCKFNEKSREAGNALCELFYGMTDQDGFCHLAEKR